MSESRQSNRKSEHARIIIWREPSSDNDRHLMASLLDWILITLSLPWASVWYINILHIVDTRCTGDIASKLNKILTTDSFNSISFNLPRGALLCHENKMLCGKVFQRFLSAWISCSLGWMLKLESGTFYTRRAPFSACRPYDRHQMLCLFSVLTHTYQSTRQTFWSWA